MSGNDVKKLGLVACTAIVAGNMMGSGIAVLPSNLAAIGSITIISWIVGLVGALALAYIFARLGVIDPQVGGPIAYSGEVAPVFGFQSGFLYFHANWIGNLAIAIAGISYLSALPGFFQELSKPVPAGIAAIVICWIFCGLNLLGAAWIGRLVTIGVTFLLCVVIATGTIGWFFFKPELFTQNWNVSGTSGFSAIASGIILCVWAFVGVESASVNAGLVDNPTKTIPASTMIGTIIAGIVYISSSTAIIGMFPAKTVSDSGAPFALAITHMVSAWPQITGIANDIVSFIIAFACIMSLGSWIMLVSQAGVRSANDGILSPKFAELDKNGVPAYGVIMTTVYMTILMIVLMLISGKSSTDTVFGYIADTAVLLTLIPYLYSSLHFMKLGTKATPKNILMIAAALMGCIFCFIALAGAEYNFLRVAVVVIFGTFILYVSGDRTKIVEKYKETQ